MDDGGGKWIEEEGGCHLEKNIIRRLSLLLEKTCRDASHLNLNCQIKYKPSQNVQSIDRERVGEGGRWGRVRGKEQRGLRPPHFLNACVYICSTMPYTMKRNYCQKTSEFLRV